MVLVADLERSGFFVWFSVRETSRAQDSRRYGFPGFTGVAALDVDIEREEVAGLTLRLDRAWLLGEGQPFAVDLARAFVRLTGGDPRMQEFSRALGALIGLTASDRPCDGPGIDVWLGLREEAAVGPMVLRIEAGRTLVLTVERGVGLAQRVASIATAEGGDRTNWGAG